jgi:hypothetical protein
MTKEFNLVVNTIDNSADPLAVRMMTKCTFCVFVLLDDGVSSYSFVLLSVPLIFYYEEKKLGEKPRRKKKITIVCVCVCVCVCSL